MITLKIWVMGKVEMLWLVVADAFIFFHMGNCARWVVKHGVRLVRKRSVLLADLADNSQERDKLLKDSADLVQLFYDKFGEA
mgnify:CR=1 FL=1